MFPRRSLSAERTGISICKRKRDVLFFIENEVESGATIHTFQPCSLANCSQAYSDVSPV